MKTQGGLNWGCFSGKKEVSIDLIKLYLKKKRWTQEIFKLQQEAALAAPVIQIQTCVEISKLLLNRNICRVLGDFCQARGKHKIS